jgi:hypothetical protein
MVDLIKRKLILLKLIYLISVVYQAVALPANMQTNSTSLEIIAQPFYGSKLRYRSDYEKNENRLGALKNKNTNSSYQGPAIRVSLINYFEKIHISLSSDSTMLSQSKRWILHSCFSCYHQI